MEYYAFDPPDKSKEKKTQEKSFVDKKVRNGGKAKMENKWQNEEKHEKMRKDGDIKSF